MGCPAEKTARVFGKCSSLLLIILFVCCGKQKDTLPYYDQADFTPIWDLDTLEHPLHEIGRFQFTDQKGSQVSNETFDGKIYIANFFFTSCPGICPRMTDNLKKVADTFRDHEDVLFISHSVTPWIDSLPRLNEFANKYTIDQHQWHLVTGNAETINTLARQSYYAENEPGLSKDSTEFLHTEHCLLIDRERRIRGVYNGTLELEMTRLQEDIVILLNE